MSLLTMVRGIFSQGACRHTKTILTQPVTVGSMPVGMSGVSVADSNHTKPLITVIVPAYNAQQTIKECVESILSQSFDDFEVIIVNDGSVDSTGELAEEMAARDSRVRVLQKMNSGVSAARNVGLQAARGQYVCVLDADDIWVADKLQSQLAAIGDDEDIVVVGGLRRFADNENGRQWLAESMPPMVDDQTDYPGTLMHLPSTSMNLIGTMLAPRRHLLEIGGWSDRLKTGEDWELWLRLSGRVRFKTLNKTLVYYRKHESSATRSHDTMWVLGQHMSILDGCCADMQGVNKRIIKSAKLIRLLESAGNLIYEHRLLEATQVLIQSAGYVCAWSTQQFYVRVQELILQSLRKLTSK